MASLARNFRLLGETSSRVNLSEATLTCSRNHMRPFSVGVALNEEEKYPPLPQARHFPIKKDTMLPPGSFAGKVLPLQYSRLEKKTNSLQVVLVTGGGTGLGKGMSLKFSSLGAKVRPIFIANVLYIADTFPSALALPSFPNSHEMKVAIASRRLPVLESAASEIKAATGGTVLPVQVSAFTLLLINWCLSWISEIQRR